LTNALALYKVLGLPFPAEPRSALQPPSYLLVYGGSTASGTIAIQFAKRSGQTVITTCSPRNFDLVKSRGADVVLDYVSSFCSVPVFLMMCGVHNARSAG